MPQRDYRAYAQTPAGKAARARAHAKYIAKRWAANARPAVFDPQPLLSAWSRHASRDPI